ncbi:MAG: YdcF family protein [Planctomycetaceae bacterium]|nr:YdcF family protein [Planctomycetaceae bacterium]
MIDRYSPDLAPLLEQAQAAYRRRDDDEFAALLEKAIAVAPSRIDLHLCLANKHIQTDRPELAVAIYDGLFDTLRDDVDVLLLLAHWRRYLGDAGEADAVRWRLAGIRPDRAVDLARIWEAVDLWLGKPVSDKLPTLPKGTKKPAILVLGHKLADDGSILPALAERLEKALEAANRYPGAFMIVTGGLPRGGRVEAQAMREWLVERGIAEDRIHEEGYARDTVENLIFSRYILDMQAADAAVVVTSGYNVRRAGACLEVLSVDYGSDRPVFAVSSGKYEDDGKDRLKVYRDVLRAYGIPMMAAYPHLAER